MKGGQDMMRIAISQRAAHATQYVEPRDGLAREWATLVARTLPDALLFPIPNHAGMVDAWLGTVAPDLVVLSGGDDWGDDPPRDEVERALFEWCRVVDRPVLGVCRGMQVLNLFLGGQHISHSLAHHEVAVEHRGAPHAVEPANPLPPVLAEIAGALPATVNSYHGNVIEARALAESLVPFALAPDGTVEAYASRAGVLPRCVGLQWHPERAMPDQSASDASFVAAVTSLASEDHR